MADDPLARVKRLIRALREKTTDRGCTEEEAMAAAEKLGELLKEHDLEMTEAMLGAETSQAEKQTVRAVDDYASSIIVGIGLMCDLITWRKSPTEFVFFGTAHDREIGSYLYEICAEAMDEDWSRDMEVNGYSMKKRASFRMGFAHRVCQRLRDIKRLRDEARVKWSSSTSLVVSKERMLQTELKKTGITLRSGGTQRPADMGAYYRGQAAGERVNLNNPLANPDRGNARIN